MMRTDGGKRGGENGQRKKERVKRRDGGAFRSISERL